MKCATLSDSTLFVIVIINIITATKTHCLGLRDPKSYLVLTKNYGSQSQY